VAVSVHLVVHSDSRVTQLDVALLDEPSRSVLCHHTTRGRLEHTLTTFVICIVMHSLLHPCSGSDARRDVHGRLGQDGIDHGRHFEALDATRHDLPPTPSQGAVVVLKGGSDTGSVVETRFRR
jgi:hypothetical protein